MTNERCATSNAIKRALKDRGITQRRAARLLQLSQPALSDRYTGKTSWRLSELERLADYLGTTVADLVQSPDMAVNR